ncbi:MAG: Gfo/Idh/MocA family oxidoreductase [Deltaproteobacteria bacterium]|nr:Gfo/Idh/MocA family oxidoreductase [Deltaproteobacteria bacterium]MBW2018605.1 Gfo/Idh/MocA family oxidoreductase [Deltaproteobacteria bacterium]MBW2073871.1 Gfo/Idh/MocA family oxidoreductase [Deltaproteobacteria bacterium]
MNILLVGLGSIGRRHLANLQAIAPECDVTILRHSNSDLVGDPENGIHRIVYSLEEAVALRPDAAIIATPAPHHVLAGTVLAKERVHLLIEKPLSHSLDGVYELMETCRRNELIAMVGYNFRFYRPFKVLREAIREGRIGKVLSINADVGMYLPDWRPGADYRNTVSAQRNLGGGVILELSHELDYVRWFGGEVAEVFAIAAHVSDLEINVEDLAEIVMTLENGAVAHVHLDMVRRAIGRSCCIIGSEGVLTWEWANHQVRLYHAGAGYWTDLCPSGDIDRNEMYFNELRHFLGCVRGAEEPIVPIEDGLRVLEIALAAKRSSQERKAIAL